MAVRRAACDHICVICVFFKKRKKTKRKRTITTDAGRLFCACTHSAPSARTVHWQRQLRRDTLVLSRIEALVGSGRGGGREAEGGDSGIQDLTPRRAKRASGGRRRAAAAAGDHTRSADQEPQSGTTALHSTTHTHTHRHRVSHVLRPGRDALPLNTYINKYT